jgi:hypothetical protein
MNCIICELELQEGDKRIMLPIDVPYCNLYVHRECRNIENDKLVVILQERLEKYLKMRNNVKKK